MIEECVFKQCQAVKLENEVIRVVILPSMGGKVASIYRKDKDFELLYQNREAVYKKAKMYDAYSNYDVSGFDDAFPSIDMSKVNIGNKEILYPDHGEIWSADFTYKIEDEKIQLMYESSIFQYRYRKAFSISEDTLIAEYEIFNFGKEEFPCIWVMHCLIVCEEDMELIFPKDTKEIINVFNHEFLGEVGKVHSYPITRTCEGKPYELNKILPLASNNMEKYYVKGAVTEGICGAYYPSKDIKYRIYFDRNKLPYLGFWITEGGFRGEYNCALEPTNGYYDSIDIAQRERGLYSIKPGETFTFTVRIEIK